MRLVVLAVFLAIAINGLCPGVPTSVNLAGAHPTHPCPPDCPHHLPMSHSSGGDCTCRPAEQGQSAITDTHMLVAMPIAAPAELGPAGYHLRPLPDLDQTYPIPILPPPRSYL